MDISGALTASPEFQNTCHAVRSNLVGRLLVRVSIRIPCNCARIAFTYQLTPEAVSMTGLEDGRAWRPMQEDFVGAPTADASNPELSVSWPESGQQQPLLVRVFERISSKPRSVLIKHCDRLMHIKN